MTLERNSPPIQSHTAGDRTPLSALPLSSCGNVSHFGGSLQGEGLPTNYVAHIASLSSKTARTFAMRTLLLFIERPGFEHDVVDVSFVVAGKVFQELPERVLGTYRMVQLKPSIALPMSFVVPKRLNEPSQISNRETGGDEPNDVTLLLKLFVTDPLLAAIDPMTRLFTSPPREHLSIPATVAQGSDHRQQRASYLATSDPLEQAVNELVKVLEHVVVPVRREQLPDQPLPADEAAVGLDGFANVPVVHLVTRGELRRFFVASHCSHSKAAMRIVEALAWRGRTFPIDKRMCRIELQNAQFFQQGCDKRGNPVFYFRSMLLGPWRKDENAAIAAVLCRLEKAIEVLDDEDTDVRFSLVVSLGKPHMNKKKRKREEKGSSSVGKDDIDSNGGTAEDGDASDCLSENSPGEQTSPPAFSNPRVEPDEAWSLHSSKRLVRTLVNMLLDYYPERLHRAYVVVAHGNTAYTRTAVGGLMKLSKYVRSSRTRDKVKFLIRYSDLRDYIDRDELITFCGGNASVHPAAFECE